MEVNKKANIQAKHDSIPKSASHTIKSSSTSHGRECLHYWVNPRGWLNETKLAYVIKVTSTKCQHENDFTLPSQATAAYIMNVKLIW